MENTLWA